MMLKVSKFQYWWNKSFAKDFILSKYIIYFHKKLKVFLMFLEGLEALKSVALKFLCEDNVEVVSKVTEKIVTPNTADSEKHFFEGMFEEEFEIENPDAIAAALVFKKEQEINSEIIKFTDLITAENFKRTLLSSNEFWKDKKRDFPHLCTLFLILNSIGASSAYIERFFSICGIICTQRNQNSKEDLFQARAMLSSNFKIVKKISINNNK